ncbi:hypothetical protein ACH5RR_015568 [Cinchona calisaya]|uniref:Uncharacterized protein n=1 Tax=Cinchona calisaya TaxID=153742 RepID=A0ABD2ZTK5_9GENT
METTLVAVVPLPGSSGMAREKTAILTLAEKDLRPIFSSITRTTGEPNKTLDKQVGSLPLVKPNTRNTILGQQEVSVPIAKVSNESQHISKCFPLTDVHSQGSQLAPATSY